MTRYEKSYLFEDRAYKNMKRARDKYLKPNGYSDDDCKEVNDFLKRTIPNVKNLECHFIEGVTRMYADGELDNSDMRDDVDQVLGYLTTTDAFNEFGNTPEGRNLNGLTAQQLVSKYADVIKDAKKADEENLSKQDFGGNNGYDIVLIDSFEKAKEYAQYTTWCVTQTQNAYNNYTKGGVFYFCLKNGFENVEKVAGINAPLDEYGLSMIAVSIYPDGSCNTITCRWNHSNGGNDKVMTTEELSKVIGENFYDVFKPLRSVMTFGGKEYVCGVTEDGDRALYDEQGNNVLGGGVEDFYVNEKLSKTLGYDLLTVESSFGKNFLKFKDGKVQYLFDEWLDSLYYEYDLSQQLGAPCFFIKQKQKCTYVILYDGKPQCLFDKWFNYCEYDCELSGDIDTPCFRIINGEKRNCIIFKDTKPEYVFDEWFDYYDYDAKASKQLDALCFYVKKDGLWNCVKCQDGKTQYLLNKWFDLDYIASAKEEYLRQLRQRNENRAQHISMLITEVVMKKLR